MCGYIINNYKCELADNRLTLLSRDSLTLSTNFCQVFDSLMVRHWDTWNCYEKRNHVFVTPLTVSSCGCLVVSPASPLTDLMADLAADCPPKPFGGAEEYQPAPEGDVMVLTCRRVTDTKQQPTDMAWSSEGTCVWYKL